MIQIRGEANMCQERLGLQANFLAKWHPVSNLDFKKLTLKTLALIALSSSDRGQTLHMLDINKLRFYDDRVSFIVDKRLKTSKRKLIPHIVECYKTELPSLNVHDYVNEYIKATENIRKDCLEKGVENSSQLFLSWATKRPVTKVTLTRWLTQVL